MLLLKCGRVEDVLLIDCNLAPVHSGINPTVLPDKTDGVWLHQGQDIVCKCDFPSSCPLALQLHFLALIKAKNNTQKHIFRLNLRFHCIYCNISIHLDCTVLT